MSYYSEYKVNYKLTEPTNVQQNDVEVPSTESVELPDLLAVRLS